MDLVAFEFGVLLGRGQTDRFPVSVYHFGDLKALLQWMSKQLLHHQHHILVGVIIVVPQDYVVARLLFVFMLLVGRRFALHNRFRNCDRILVRHENQKLWFSPTKIETGVKGGGNAEGSHEPILVANGQRKKMCFYLETEHKLYDSLKWAT